MALLGPRPVGAALRGGPAAGDDSSKDTKTMLTCGLLPPRLTEPEIGRSVFPPDSLMDKATPQRGRLESQAAGFSV